MEKLPKYEGPQFPGHHRRLGDGVRKHCELIYLVLDTGR